MPMLLEDLAGMTSASFRQAADRLEAELRDLAVRLDTERPDDLLEEVVELARRVTDYVITRLPQVEGDWQWVVATLRPGLSPGDAQRLLEIAASALESSKRMARGPRKLWQVAAQLGVTPERLDELDRVESRFAELAAEARRALDHRARGWRPADPERLALGLRLAAEGKTVGPEEARAWFRRVGG